jgi:hypothetical protein
MAHNAHDDNMYQSVKANLIVHVTKELYRYKIREGVALRRLRMRPSGSPARQLDIDQIEDALARSASTFYSPWMIEAEDTSAVFLSQHVVVLIAARLIGQPGACVGSRSRGERAQSRGG